MIDQILFRSANAHQNVIQEQFGETRPALSAARIAAFVIEAIAHSPSAMVVGTRAKAHSVALHVTPFLISVLIKIDHNRPETLGFQASLHCVSPLKQTPTNRLVSDINLDEQACRRVALAWRSTTDAPL